MSKNVDENGIERIWVKNLLGKPVNIKVGNLEEALRRGGKLIESPEQSNTENQPTKNSADLTDRITEAARGFAGGVAAYGDLANKVSLGNINEYAGNMIDAVSIGAKKLGFDTVGKSTDEFAKEVRKDDFKWKDKTKNLDVFKTENKPDEITSILEAGGDMATDAPIFKGLGMLAKRINIGVNGKEIVNPLINRVSKFLESPQSLGKMSIEFAGAGAGADIGKQIVEGEEAYEAHYNKIVGKNEDTSRPIKKALYEVAGALVGGMTINTASRKVASMFEEPVKLTGELLDILYPSKPKDTNVIKLFAEKELSKEEKLKDLGSRTKEWAKEAVDFSPLQNLYVYLNSGIKKDKESVNNMLSIMKEVGIKPNVFNTFDENKVSYVIASWLPDESLKQMLKNDRQKFITYIEKTIDEGSMSVEEIAKKTSNLDSVKDNISIMSSANEVMETKVKQFVDFEVQRKNSLYKKIDKLVANNNNNNIPVDTSSIVYTSEQILNDIFLSEVTDSSKKYVKDKVVHLLNTLSQNGKNELPLNKYVQQMKDLSQLAYDPATLGNFNGLIYKISEQMEDTLMQGIKTNKSIPSNIDIPKTKGKSSNSSKNSIAKKELESSDLLNKLLVEKSMGELTNVTKGLSNAGFLDSFLNMAKSELGQSIKNTKKIVANQIEEQPVSNLGAEIVELIKKANKNYSESYAPIMKSDLVQAVTKGQKPEFVFKVMDTPEGLQHTEYLLKRIDDWELAHHNKIKKHIETKPVQKGSDRITAEIFRDIDLREHITKTPVSLKDTIFRLKAQQIIQENLVKNEIFDPKKFIDLFENRDSYLQFRTLVGEDVFKKLRANALPMARKMEKIMQTDQHYGSGLSGRSHIRSNTEKASSALLPFGIGMAFGGVNAGGVTAGIAVLGLKEFIANSFAKAATNPKTVNRLIQIIEKGDEQKLMNFLVKVKESTGAKYKTLELLTDKTTNEVKENITNPEARKKIGKKMMEDGIENRKTIGY